MKLRIILFLTTLLAGLLATTAFSMRSPNPNEGGGGGGGYGNWCVGPPTAGHLANINGHVYQCTEGRGAYWAWTYQYGYGYIDGYPSVLDCPCWYYRYISG